MTGPPIDYTVHYRRYHDGSPENVAAMVGYFRRSLEGLLPSKRDAPILEIGSGVGFCLRALVEAGFTCVSGIDIDPGQVAEARRNGLPAELVPVDVQPTFFADRRGRFELILAFDVIEHLPVKEQIAFVHRLASALAPGGRLVCQVPNALSPLASFQRYVDWTHHSSFTPDSIEFVIRSAGLEPVAIKPSIDPEPVRTLWKRLIVKSVRAPVRLLVRGMWRLTLVSELGLSRGLREPISINLIAVARKA